MATEPKKANNRIFVVVGAVLAVAAGGLTLYISRSNNNSGTSSSGTTGPVVVAKADIPQGTALTNDLLAIEQLPLEQQPTGAVPDPAAVIGKFTSVAVAKNQVITPGVIAPDAKTATTTAITQAPLSIDPGFVALAIKVPGGDIDSVGGNVQKDDHIDFLIDPKGDGSEVRYGFQDVRVLQVGDLGAAATAAPNIYVIELPRAQAEEMVFLMKGTTAKVVQMVLRPRAEYGKGYQDIKDPNVQPSKDNPVTPQFFAGLFH